MAGVILGIPQAKTFLRELEHGVILECQIPSATYLLAGTKHWYNAQQALSEGFARLKETDYILMMLVIFRGGCG